jgi:hypothetical protein
MQSDVAAPAAITDDDTPAAVRGQHTVLAVPCFLG